MMAEEIRGVKRVTLYWNNNYDTLDPVKELRWMNITPRRTTRYAGYEGASGSENEWSSRSGG